MKSRSRSSKNAISLCKGQGKQVYKHNQIPPTMLVSNSVDLCNPLNDKPHNFILANKKNLRNFFKDRIPQQKIQIGEKVTFLSPTKIFKLRQQQFSKQQTTKITLHKSFEVCSKISKTPSTYKMNETFHARGLQKIVTSPSQNSKNFKFTSANSYYTPTSSYLVKRSQTVKKQAYISVFGDKLMEQKSRLLEIESATNLSAYEDKEAKRNQRPRPKTHLNNSHKKQDRQKLGMLLANIEQFANFVNPHRAPTSLKEKSINPEIIEIKFKAKEQTEKNELISWVKEASNDYKRRNENFEAKRMKTVEDIQKLDPGFYTKMKKHKNDRLWVRNKALGGLSNYKIEDLSFKMDKQSGYNFTDQDEWVNQMITITDRNNVNTIEIEKPNEKYNFLFKQNIITRHQKLQQFGKRLVEATNEAKLYGIHLDHIYLVMWKERKPYQLEGSYAFFKYIKKGDLEMVQNFILKNYEYAHQVDNELRTPLIYAVQNNKLNVVKCLLKVGVNVNAKNAKGQTAIQFAIAKNSHEMVKAILEAGGNPWSTPHYNISNLLDGISDQRIDIAIKNARKISLALKLMKKPQVRDQFWKKYRQKMGGQQVLTFL